MSSSPRQRKSGKLEADTPLNAEFQMPKADVKAAISTQIGKGQQLYDLPINTQEELSDALSKKSNWIKFTAELLRRAFSNSGYADEFEGRGLGAIGFYSLGPTLFSERVHDYQKGIQQHLSRLESIHERLDLIPETSGSRLGVPRDPSLSRSRRVFVVHGQSDAVKVNVARFLEHLDLEPIILHEQPDSGATLIEKLEHNSDVSYAVILLTADDEGFPKGHPEKKLPRARQNVILEFGLFIGKIGRERTCILYDSGVELPSDLHGLVYVEIDKNDGWKLKLAKNLRAVGMEIDLNRIS